MACFFNKIDAKGRIFIPSKAKVGMGERMYVTISRDPNYLVVYNEARFQRVCDEFDKKEIENIAQMRAKRIIVGGALECEPDSQGRITISSKLWDRIGAKPSSEICIVQYRDMLEICTKEFYESPEGDDMMGTISFEDCYGISGL